MLESTNIPEIKKACTVVRNMSEDARLREISYQREKRLHDEASALGSTGREGEQNGINKMINNMRLAGIPEEEIKRL